MRRGRRFELDKNNDLIEVHSIPPKLEASLKESQKKFGDIFGRKPKRHDRLLFDTYMHSERDYYRQARATAERAGIDGVLIFAWQRTGFLLAETNKHLFSKADKEEWSRAVKEYGELKKAGVDPFAVIDFDHLESYFICKGLSIFLENNLIILGNFIDRNSKTRLDERSFLAAYFVVRAQHSLRTAFHLLETRATEDTLAILRNVYEAFVRIRALRCNESVLKALIAQLAVGRAPYKFKQRKNGRVDRNVIVNTDTSEQYPSFYSLVDLVKLSDVATDIEVYHSLNGYFARYSHVKISDLPSFFNMEEGLSLHAEESPTEVTLVAAFVALCLFDELAHWKRFESTSCRDITRQKSIGAELLDGIEETFETIQIFPDQFSALRRRISDLAKHQ